MSISEYNFPAYWEATEHAAKQKAGSVPQYIEEGNNSEEKHVKIASKIHKKCATDQRKANSTAEDTNTWASA